MEGKILILVEIFRLRLVLDIMIEHYIYSPPDNSSPDNMWYWKVADRVACFIKIGDELSEDKLSGASCQWMGCQRANSRRVYN